VIDPHTLEIRLNHPVPYFLQLMGFYPFSPVNRRCVETHGYPAWTRPENLVGNGAFRLEFRRVRDRIRLVKSPTYWNRDQVQLQTIDALAVKSTTTMLNLYMTGKADWITAVPTEVVTDLLARDDFEPAPYLALYYYLINTQRPPLNDPRVRRALAMAVDRREIVEQVTRSGQVPAYSLVPEEISNYVDYSPPAFGTFDPEQARKLLAEAGFPGGRGCPRIEVLYNTHESHKAIAEVVQAQWKRHLGIDVTLSNQEWGAYLTSRRQGRFMVARAGWIGDYIDPNTFLDLFTSDNPQNQSGWSHAEYDRLVDEAQREPDDRRRMELFPRGRGHPAGRVAHDSVLSVRFPVDGPPVCHGFLSEYPGRPSVVGDRDRPAEARPVAPRGGPAMTAFFVRRLLWLVLTLWIVFTVSFFLMRSVPGGPFSQERELEPQIAELIQERYRLDDPLWQQYLRELTAALRGDLGYSYRKPDFSNAEIIAQGLPVSASLGIVAWLSRSFGLAGRDHLGRPAGHPGRCRVDAGRHRRHCAAELHHRQRADHPVGVPGARVSRGRLGVAQPVDPARVLSGRPLRGLHRPADADRHAGHPFAGLHPDGLRQGALRPDRDPAPRLASGDGARGIVPGTGHRGDPDRVAGHRADLCHSGAGSALCRGGA
jgi:hypothetical protein